MTQENLIRGRYIKNLIRQLDSLARLLLIPWRKVKKLLGWGLLGIAAIYFYGYAPPDLLPSLPTIHTSGAKVRAPEAREQAPAATPQRNAVTTTATETQDGSLANRWEPHPSPSPKKP